MSYSNADRLTDVIKQAIHERLSSLNDNMLETADISIYINVKPEVEHDKIELGIQIVPEPLVPWIAPAGFNRGQIK